jgi:hypothetical protein
VKTTINLYFKLTGVLLIVVFCKIQSVEATEISPLIGFGQENFVFNLKDIGPEKREIGFEPNITGVSRLGLKIFGFSVGYSFRGNRKDLDPAKGSTTFSDWQLGYQSHNWGLEAFYQTYTGFYTSSMPMMQLYPDLQFEHYAVTGRYAMNDSEFTVSGLYDQSEPITETAGKWYLMGGLRQYRMETPISLLQQNYSGIDNEIENMRGLTSSSLNFGVGAGKYWVNDNKLFAGILLDIFLTYGLYNYKFVGGDTNKSSYTTLSYDLKVGAGYAGEKYKFGLGTSADLVTLRTSRDGYFQSISARALLYFRFVF